MGTPAVNRRCNCAGLRLQISHTCSNLIQLFKLYVKGGLWFVLALLASSPASRAQPGCNHLRRFLTFAQPQDDSNSFQAGLAALKENRFADALESLTAAEREHGDDPRIRNFRGIVLGQLGRGSEAESEFQEAIRLDPRFEDAHRNLGFLLWTQHKLEPARSALIRALELSPDDSFAHYYLGRVQLDAQQYAGAITELKQFRGPWPTDPDFLLQVAGAYRELKRNDEARQTLNQITAISLSDLQSAHASQLLLAIHESERAINVLKKIIAEHSTGDESWARFDLALIYLLSANYAEAAKQAQSLTASLRANKSQHDTEVAAWSLLGIAQAQNGNGDEAVLALRRAATLDPGNEEGWLNLTRELMELKRHADTLSAVQEGIAANPKSYALQLRLGAAYLAAGRYSEAENAFRTLVAADDPLPTSYVGLAQTLLREGRAEGAASELATAQQKIGQSFLLSYFMGLALERAGKRQEAISAYRDAIQQNPASSEAHLGIGKLELASGLVNEAIVELEEALRLSPGNIQARRLLSQAYQRAGNEERAQQYAEAAAKDTPAPEGDLLGDFILPKWRSP